MFSSGHRYRRVTLPAELLDEILSQTSLGAEDRELLAEQALLEAIENQPTPTLSSHSTRSRRSSTRAPAYRPEEPVAEGRSIPYDPNDWQPRSFGAWRSRRALSSNSSRSALRYSPTTPPSSVWSRSERFSQPYDPSFPLLPLTGVSDGVQDIGLYTPTRYQSNSSPVLPGGERSRVPSGFQADDKSKSELLVTQADMHACMNKFSHEMVTGQQRLEQAFFDHLEQLWDRLESRMKKISAASLVQNSQSREATAPSPTDGREAGRSITASRKRKTSAGKKVSFGSPMTPPKKRRRASDVSAKSEQQPQGTSLRRSARLNPK